MLELTQKEIESARSGNPFCPPPPFLDHSPEGRFLRFLRLCEYRLHYIMGGN